MNKYCRKCGKLLVVKSKIVYGANTGNPDTKIVGSKCPSRTVFDFFETHDQNDEHGRLHYFEYE